MDVLGVSFFFPKLSLTAMTNFSQNFGIVRKLRPMHCSDSFKIPRLNYRNQQTPECGHCSEHWLPDEKFRVDETLWSVEKFNWHVLKQSWICIMLNHIGTSDLLHLQQGVLQTRRDVRENSSGIVDWWAPSNQKPRSNSKISISVPTYVCNSVYQKSKL